MAGIEVQTAWFKASKERLWPIALRRILGVKELIWGWSSLFWGLIVLILCLRGLDWGPIGLIWGLRCLI